MEIANHDVLSNIVGSPFPQPCSCQVFTAQKPTDLRCGHCGHGRRSHGLPGRSLPPTPEHIGLHRLFVLLDGGRTELHPSSLSDETEEEETEGVWRQQAVWLERGILALVGLNAIAFVLQTEPSVQDMPAAMTGFQILHTVSSLLFTVEYFCRLLAAPGGLQDSDFPRLRWATSVFGMVDLCSILLSCAGLIWPALSYLPGPVVRIVRVVQVLNPEDVGEFGSRPHKSSSPSSNVLILSSPVSQIAYGRCSNRRR